MFPFVQVAESGHGQKGSATAMGWSAVERIDLIKAQGNAGVGTEKRRNFLRLRLIDVQLTSQQRRIGLFEALAHLFPRHG